MSKPLLLSLAHKHQLRALSRWPTDALRPECQFQDAMQRRIARRFGVPSPSPSSSHAPSPAPGKTQVGSEALAGRETEVATPTTTVAMGSEEVAERELAQANALYALVENRFRKKYAIAGKLLEPTSKPSYYTDLLKELQQAPTRSWWGNKINQWRGFLRMQ